MSDARLPWWKRGLVALAAITLASQQLLGILGLLGWLPLFDDGGADLGDCMVVAAGERVVVPCTEPYNRRLVLELEGPDAWTYDHLHEDGPWRDMHVACESGYRREAGEPPPRSIIRVVEPSRASWEDGNHRLWCALETADGRLLSEGEDG